MQHVILVILHKSLKSLQLVLNEFFSKLCNALDTVSASAFTQARSKLAYTAFIELPRFSTGLHTITGMSKPTKGVSSVDRRQRLRHSLLKSFVRPSTNGSQDAFNF